MKKNTIIILILLLLVLVLSACNGDIGGSPSTDDPLASSQPPIDDSTTEETQNSTEGESDLIYSYRSGVYHNKNWSDDWGTYTSDAIPDVDTAISVASALFENVKKDGIGQTYILNSVFFDTEDNIWIITFSQSTDSSVDGGEFNIALSQTTGNVIRMWFGE